MYDPNKDGDLNKDDDPNKDEDGKERGLKRVFALDYDLSSTIALMIWYGAQTGDEDFEKQLLGIMNGH